MTQMLEQLPAPVTETVFSKADRVTLVFEFRFSQEASWTPLEYTIEGSIVGGLQAYERPNDIFEPYVLPDRPVPEGDKFASGHPFALNEAPFDQTLEDGKTIQLRYLAIHSDVIVDADKRITEEDKRFAEATI